jgi:vacuolar protein sorting-associated protein IST1
VKSLIYSAPRTEVKELQQVRQLLVEKYGKDFALAAIENSDGKVSEQVLKKLRVEAPEQTLVTLYLKEIARTYNIAYGNDVVRGDPSDEDPSGGEKEAIPVAVVDSKEVELAKATPPKQLRSPINIAPPSPTTENVHPVVKLPEAPKFSSPSARSISNTRTKLNADDDDLARRFAALKR